MGEIVTIPAGKLLRRRMHEVWAADQKLADHAEGCPDCKAGERCAEGRQLYEADALKAWREVVQASREPATTDN